MTAAVAATPPAPAAKVLDVAKADGPLPLPMMLKAAAEQTGKSLQQIVLDLAKMSFGPGKISVEDYFSLRLFDDKAQSPAERRAFAGPRAFKAMSTEINVNEHWLVTTGHKLVTEAVLRGFGFPVARTRALYSRAAAYPGFVMLESADDLDTYLDDPCNYPLFGKPIDSSLSLGTAGLSSLDEATNEIVLANGERVARQAFIADIVAHYGDGYLFQEPLRPHASVRALIGDRLPTVRFYTFNGPKGPELFRAVWKIPAGKSMADNFWRGNLLASLDYETGTIKRAIRGCGLDLAEVECHPDTGARLIGAAIPDWQATKAMVLAAARALTEVPLVGWDVAPTEAGGVIVEGNDNPDFRLVQMAEGRGILDDTFLGMLAWAREVRRQMKADDKSAGRQARRAAVRKVLDAAA